MPNGELMMYIDTTAPPLEDNDQPQQQQQYTRRKEHPTPSASAATNVLLSTRFFAQADEEAATHLHLAQYEEEERERQKNKKVIAAAAENYFTSCRLQLSNNKIDKVAHFPIGTDSRKKTQTPQTEQEQQRAAADDEPEEDEEEVGEPEHYELVDVFDSEEEEDTLIEEQQHLHQHQPESHEIVFQIEEAEGGGESEKLDDDFEYIVTRVQSENNLLGRPRKPLPNICPAELLPITRKSLTAINRQSLGQQRAVQVRTTRSIPDVIPLRFYASSTAAEQLHHQTKSVHSTRHRLLNDSLPIFKRSNSQTSSTSSYSGHSAARLYQPTHNNPRFEEEEQAEAEWIAENQAQDSQMGFDIYNKLRRLLNLNTGSSNNYDTHEGTRKRRSEDRVIDNSNPHQIKYRKVENRFPKYITHTLDDDLEISFPLKQHEQKQTHFKKPPKSSMDMTQRRSLHPIEKPKLRKSIFEAPQITHKLIKNTPYADVEFSDDDEPELIKGFGIGPSLGGGGAVKKSPKLFNIPISQRAQKPPPLPLIDARTGSILASSLVPELDAIRKPTYADALRHSISSSIAGGSAGGGHILGGGGGRAVSSMSSSGASTSATAHGYNWLRNIRANAWSQNARSILAQKKESDDRDKYQQLLEQVVPRIYGVENITPQLSKEAARHNQSAARRRSALLVAAATSRQARNSPDTSGAVSSRRSLHNDLTLKPRPPLSSTINLNDDDDDEDDVTFTGVSRIGTLPSMSAVIIDDDDISDIVDLGDDERNVVSTCAKLRQEAAEASVLFGLDAKKKRSQNDRKLPYVDPINSLQERFNASIHLKDKWLENWELKCNQRKEARSLEVIETEKVAEKLGAERRAAEVEIHDRLRKFQIVYPEILVIDDFPEPIIDEEPEFIELTAEHQARIKAAICGPPDQVLVSKFNLNITRRDIHTLLGNNWLNDEVINFYMNLLTERGEKQGGEGGGRLPSVYAMNTFFVPRLMQAGHGGVKRWTRKVDIFGKDVVPVPVHVGGVHWCMAVIHLRNRTIKYYDSMGTPNPNVLKALEQYLKDESLDKRKQPFDTSAFEIESVREVPRQMNGSDCGVFSCMFAEYITRNREITFSQQHMEYFRHKMVLEIVQGKLLH